MKYEKPEEGSFMVKEPVAAYGGQLGITDALWTLISSQAQEVQEALREKLNSVLPGSHEFEPYTMEEINDRIDEAEDDIRAGRLYDGETLHAQLKEKYSWL